MTTFKAMKRLAAMCALLIAGSGVSSQTLGNALSVYSNPIPSFESFNGYNLPSGQAFNLTPLPNSLVGGTQFQPGISNLFPFVENSLGSQFYHPLFLNSPNPNFDPTFGRTGALSGLTALPLAPANTSGRLARTATGGASDSSNAKPQVPIAASLGQDRLTVVSLKSAGKKSQPVPVETMVALCADLDGCQVRLGQQLKKDDGIVMAANTVLYINPATGGWSSGVLGGQKDSDASSQNVLSAGTCFLSDGEFDDAGNSTDAGLGFGLVSYVAPNGDANTYSDCVLTIVD